jgi:hypothetical protein
LPVNLGKAQIKTYQQRAFNAFYSEINEVVARGVIFQVSHCAKSFIIAVEKLSIRGYQVQTVMRFMLSRQFVGAAQNNPKAEFGGKGHYVFCLLF